MISEIGTMKSGISPTLQTNPTAPVQNRGLDPAEERKAVKAPAETGQADARQPEPLESVVSDLNSLVRNLHRELMFSVDQESGETVIKVVDKETDEVVRQIPSEELMELRRRLQDAAGIIFRDSA